MKKLFVLYSSIRAKLRCFSFLQKNFFLMITIIGNVFGLLLNQLNCELVDSVCCQYEIMRYKSRINYSSRPGLAGQSHKTAGEVFIKTKFCTLTIIPSDTLSSRCYKHCKDPKDQ